MKQCCIYIQHGNSLQSSMKDVDFTLAWLCTPAIR